MRTLLPLLGRLARAPPSAHALPSAAAADAAPAAVLDLEPYRRTVAVRVEANGVPGLLAFDTAGGHTIVSPEFAAAAGCAPWGGLGGFTMTGKRLDMPRCDDIEFSAGGHRLREPVAGGVQGEPRTETG